MLEISLVSDENDRGVLGASSEFSLPESDILEGLTIGYVEDYDGCTRVTHVHGDLRRVL